MSSLTRLAAARMQLAEILATPCAKCGHPLKSHPVSARIEGSACRHYDVIDHPQGYPAGNATLKYCRCKAWADVEPSEKLFEVGG